jgi:hypothetical protein
MAPFLGFMAVPFDKRREYWADIDTRAGFS